MKLGWRRPGRKQAAANVSLAGNESRSWRRWPTSAFWILVPLLAVCLTGVSFLYAAKKDPGKKAARSLAGSPPIKPNGTSPSFQRIEDGKFTEYRQPYRFTYSVDPVLQASVEEVLRVHKPPFSAFVALDPKTGRILALAEYCRTNGEDREIWRRATYPAASVFKIITAACALETGALNYDSSVSFRGNQYRLGPGKLNQPAKGEHQTHFDEAMGKSNNVVFGRVASNLVGSEAMRRYSSAFGFNQSLPFDFPVDPSKAVIPDESYELARCGAGFGEVTLNPLHGALIAASVANGGVMMRPYLIEKIHGQNGETLYEAQAAEWARPISAKTAQDLNLMMRRTVEDGTASRIFQRYGKNLLKKMTVSGKTGSLSGPNPPGLYDWFVGFAPAEDPQIAFAAMAINHQRSKFRGVFLAQEALKTFFRGQLD